MASTWRRVWRSRVVSCTKRSDGGGGSGADSIRHSDQRPPQPDLADYIYTNYGINSTTTASGTNTTCTTGTATTSSSVSALAAARMPPNASTSIVEEDWVEVGGLTEQDKAKTREHVRELIHGGSLGLGVAATTIDSSGDTLERWLGELQVSWVLHLAQLDASAGRAFVSRRLQHTARSWVRALHVISRAIVSFTGWWCHSQEEEEEEQEDALQSWPPTSELVGFFAATFSHMLPFVDVILALEIIEPSASDDGHQIVSGSSGGVASSHKFQALADIHDALAGALEHVQLWELWLCSSLQLQDEATKQSSGEMSSLLLAKLDRLDEAIRDTRDYVKTQFLSLTRDRDHHDPKTSPGIHKATKSMLSCIIVLSTDHKRSVVDPPTAHGAAAASVRAHAEHLSAATGNEKTRSSTNLVMPVIRSLEEKLTRESESFSDQSLRYLFLINNLYFVWHQLRSDRRFVDVPMHALTHKIDDYIDSYVHVSWTPVLKPLHEHDHTPCCFTGYSARYKFETKFEKTYTTQKLWKVPDPELREVLRTTIIKKVIPAFTRFLKDNNNAVSASRVTPKELEEMLEELFEG